MGERGSIQRYAYWSDRRIRTIAEENDIEVDGRTRWTVKSPSVPFVPSFERTQEPRNVAKSAIARKIETAIGALAVDDFVTPPPVRFAKGVGRVDLAVFEVRNDREGVVIHTCARSSTGVRVAACLFGSLENTADYVGASDKVPEGWTSSAAPSIQILLNSRGQINNSQWDDEALAVEALKVAREQGKTGSWGEHEGKPWTRGFTLSHADESEWFAEIYLDVELDKERWGSDWQDVDRILVGAPLWVRTPGTDSVTRYGRLRRSIDFGN